MTEPATAATEQYAWPFEEASEDDRFAHMAGAHGFLFDGVEMHARLHEIGQDGRMPAPLRLPAAVCRDPLEASWLTQPVRSLLAVSAQAAPTRTMMRAAEQCGAPTRERCTPADAAGRRPQMSDSPTRATAAALPPGVLRDIAAAVRQLGKAIEALRRVDQRLDGEDSDRFGHTLDAACIASDGLLRFTEGGWASDVGIVRRHDGR